ncbi:MAG: glutathione S-transferase N-terminal domain-containing protein, partial [Rhizobiaceae bacterium]
MALLLHDYFRSSACYRVRIALNLKGLSYRQQSHHLVKGEHRAPAYLTINPQGFVPTLVDAPDNITPSHAINENLEQAKTATTSQL